VERYYYELRKSLFDFDQVLSTQREDTYSSRDAALRADAADTSRRMREMSAAVASSIVDANAPPAEAAGGCDAAAAEVISTKLGQFFPSSRLGADSLVGKSAEELRTAAREEAEHAYALKASALDAVRADLACETARYLSLLQMDNLWKQHVRAMGFVKDFAALKVYAQQDPLDVYRSEGLELYDSMQTALRQNTVFSFFQYSPSGK